MIVSGTSTIWLNDAALAVTVTVAVVGVDPPPPDPPPPDDPPPLPQAATQPIPTIAKAIISQWRIERRRKMNAQTSPASATTGDKERWSGRLNAAVAPAEIVSFVVADPPAVVTVVGLKLHVASPAGNMEQVNETAELNPPNGATVSVTSPWLPELIVSEAWLAPKVNPGVIVSRAPYTWLVP